MTIVGTGGADPALTKFGLIVLALCAAQAMADWFQLYFLYSLAAIWTDKIRSEAYAKILAQDKSWFDDSLHSPVRIVQSLVKDVDDMRLLVASVIGKFTVFVVMVGLGIIWAMTVDWRLTLIGVALAPVFAVIIGLNNQMISAAEVRNKAKREAVARTFYEVTPSPLLLLDLADILSQSPTSVGSAQCRLKRLSMLASTRMRRVPEPREYELD